MESIIERPKSKNLSHKFSILLLCLLAVLSSGALGYILGNKDSTTITQQDLELIFMISDPVPKDPDKSAPQGPSESDGRPIKGSEKESFESKEQEPGPSNESESDPIEPWEPMIPIEPSKPQDPHTHGSTHGSSQIDPEQGGLDVIDPNGHSWNQTEIIECFKDQNGDPIKLQPGTSGQAQLQLINNHSKDFLISFSFIEDQIHLPLNLTLKSLDQNGEPDLTRKELRGTLKNHRCDLADDWILEAKQKMNIVFEWEWPYEGQEDIIDTLAGKSGLEYKLKITVQADEVRL